MKLQVYYESYRARLEGPGGQRVSSAEPAEILVWEMHATIDG